MIHLAFFITTTTTHVELETFFQSLLNRVINRFQLLISQLPGFACIINWGKQKRWHNLGTNVIC